jgi:membrane-associated protease RseP (regulator of RpoE activity)
MLGASGGCRIGTLPLLPVICQQTNIFGAKVYHFRTAPWCVGVLGWPGACFIDFDRGLCVASASGRDEPAARGKRAMDPVTTTILFVAGALIGFIIFVLVFRWIWNHTVPAVFGLKTITFWQAVGILILASILTGGHRVVSPDVTNIISFPKRTGAVSATTVLPG